jgi:hypothetical protein
VNSSVFRGVDSPPLFVFAIPPSKEAFYLSEILLSPKMQVKPFPLPSLPLRLAPASAGDYIGVCKLKQKVLDPICG